ncbi:hypothetical protein [Clostridium sp. OM02-18AC]|uniref:hypothetical protein n=1 Tax=Clostridium sp. OM02-18AC TaxID=2292311 RepID=UPI0015FD20E9|nr:hypothetical protein [Clostridium sp. OM02-18AC]
MTSKNGTPELISLLQYMKDTRSDNPNILCWDNRLTQIDQVVKEVKQSEEWEAVQMSILSIGMERGQKIGEALGESRGEAYVLTDLIIKKMKRGLAPEQIADMLEINLAIVKEICNVAKDYAPDYDVKKISEAYQKESLCPTAK